MRRKKSKNDKLKLGSIVRRGLSLNKFFQILGTLRWKEYLGQEVVFKNMFCWIKGSVLCRNKGIAVFNKGITVIFFHHFSNKVYWGESTELIMFCFLNIFEVQYKQMAARSNSWIVTTGLRLSSRKSSNRCSMGVATAAVARATAASTADKVASPTGADIRNLHTLSHIHSFTSTLKSPTLQPTPADTHRAIFW